MSLSFDPVTNRPESTGYQAVQVTEYLWPSLFVLSTLHRQQEDPSPVLAVAVS